MHIVIILLINEQFDLGSALFALNLKVNKLFVNNFIRPLKFCNNILGTRTILIIFIQIYAPPNLIGKSLPNNTKNGARTLNLGVFAHIFVSIMSLKDSGR